MKLYVPPHYFLIKVHLHYILILSSNVKHDERVRSNHARRLHDRVQRQVQRTQGEYVDPSCAPAQATLLTWHTSSWKMPGSSYSLLILYFASLSLFLHAMQVRMKAAYGVCG
jgi:hypothetical protein